MGITSKVWRIDHSYREYFSFFVISASICSAAFAYLSRKLIGIDLRAILYDGVAGQNVLGSVFQPSSFGVFLLLSIYMFLRNKAFVAVLFLGVAVNFHASYILGAATLTLSYIVLIILEEKNYSKAFFVGFFSLVVVMPTIAYTYLSFSPTSPEVMSQAQGILVNYRIPHHSKVDIWFDSGALIKISIIILALLVHRKNKIFYIILIPFIISLSLTIIQVITNSNFLALLFPWRISVFLIPLSTFILIGGAVSFVFRRYSQQINDNKKIINMLLAFIFIFGIYFNYKKYKQHNTADFLPMMAFVADTKTKDDIYLIPTELKRFRLQTGVRIFVDKKTHPYKDSEVIDWYDRIQIANKLFNSGTELHCNVLQGISSKYHITHIVINSKEHVLNCNFSVKTFNDGIYSVYKIISLK